MIIFYVILAIIILQRLVELKIAASNERWMKARGGIEVGKEHYKYFIILHTLFFLFLIIEVQTKYYFGKETFHLFFFFIFVLAQLGRIWCMYSLGKFWNTKIIVLPKVSIIKKGPYKYIKHPNYLIVFIELLAISAMFGAFVSALLFPFFHLLLLTVRIPLEEQALYEKIPK